MPYRMLCLLGIFLFGVLPYHPAKTDTVTLINGDHFSGKLLEREGGRMMFQSEYAGRLRVRWQHVRSLATDKPALLQFSNGESISVLSVDIAGREITYRDAGSKQIKTLDADGIVGISPESWMKNESGEWQGRVNLAIKSDRGNGAGDFADFDADVTYRRIKDRWRLTGEWERDSKQNQNTGKKRIIKNKLLLSGSYSYFLRKKTFLSAVLSFEKDETADLDLRTVAGPLIGYQFYESRPLNLLAEIGLLWVDEDYAAAEDKSFWHPAWHINFDKYLLKNRLQFYHEQHGVITVDAEDRWFFKSWTGFRVPIGRGLQASVEYKMEYDNSPVNDNDSTESTVRLKLGYKW